jgi:hypothetical protein
MSDGPSIKYKTTATALSPRRKNEVKGERMNVGYNILDGYV